MRTIARLIVAALALFATQAARAHTQSYGFLAVSAHEHALQGRLELAARDIDLAYDLDTNGDGRITWGEFRSREAELARALLGGIRLGASDRSCPLSGRPALIDRRGGDAYVVIPFDGACPAAGGPIEIGYDLLFDIDAQHRALAAVTYAGRTQTFVMAPDSNQISLDDDHTDSASLFFTFIAHGAHHIWIGYDHILFLVTLLLAAGVMRADGRWVPVDKLGSALVAAAKVVTSFTLAHSVTLGLAAFGILRLPPALAESAIAATIVLAAINNIVPVVTRRIWLVAFGFGLVHGVGFANVLADLDLPREGLLTALLAFNLGVEFGQLVIVFAVLPPLILVCRKPAYARIALPAVSLAVAVVGSLWFVERAFGVTLVPVG
jgi:hypothetical protein